MMYTFMSDTHRYSLW